LDFVDVFTATTMNDIRFEWEPSCRAELETNKSRKRRFPDADELALDPAEETQVELGVPGGVSLDAARLAAKKRRVVAKRADPLVTPVKTLGAGAPPKVTPEKTAKASETAAAEAEKEPGKKVCPKGVKGKGKGKGKGVGEKKKGKVVPLDDLEPPKGDDASEPAGPKPVTTPADITYNDVIKTLPEDSYV
jgi:hypothetical protein